MGNTIDLYKAIEKMRELSKNDKPFSFSFMSCSLERQNSDGIINVARGKLTPQTPKNKNQYSDIMLNYYDLETGEHRQFYQPLLMTFNGLLTELK